MKVERAAAYIRVSTQEQKMHGISLDAQKMKLQDYANSHNLTIVKWYTDDGVSGRKLIKNRPALQEMIKDAQDKQFERIIFIKLDRFFRSVAEYHECMKLISPVIWTATEEKYDLATPQGELMVNMKLTIAQYEADQTGERIRITNEYKVRKGEPLTGAVPLGFKIIETPAGKRIGHDPETESILYDVIDYFKTYQSQRKTRFYMHDKYNIDMCQKAFKKLMRNPMLYGEYRGNANYCDPYISKDDFDRLQHCIKTNIKTGTKHTYLFTSLLVCPECGRRMGGTFSNGCKLYRCPNHLNYHICSNNHVANEKKLERQLLEHIEPLFKSASATVDPKPQQPRKNPDKIQAEIDRLNYSWQKGRMTVEKYDKEYSRLVDERNTLSDRLSESHTEDLSYIDEILNSGWKSVYDALNMESRRAFWRSFIKEIHVEYKDGVYLLTDVIFL